MEEEKMENKAKTRISLKSQLNNILSHFSFLEESWPFILALVLGLLIAVFVFWKLLKGPSKGNAVAILGPCSSGKTNLFSRLCYGMDVLTVTSIKESAGYFTLANGKKLLMYDVPGHDRIRYAMFDKVKTNVKAILFMLDASTIHDSIRDVAEFLYTIFCDGAIQNSRLPVLIVCNKQDLPTAKGANLVRSSLENEMNLLRITKANQLKSVGGQNNNSFLGNPDKDFEFSQLKPLKVTFVEAVAEEGKQIDEIVSWLQTIG